MKLEFDFGSAEYVIRSCRRGAVVVNEETLEASCIVMPDRLIRDWHPQSVIDLRPQDIADLIALEPDVVLLGTGLRLQFPPAGLLAPLAEGGIGVEVMATDAACRAYAVLMAEGRRVAAALLRNV